MINLFENKTPQVGFYILSCDLVGFEKEERKGKRRARKGEKGSRRGKKGEELNRNPERKTEITKNKIKLHFFFFLPSSICLK